MNDPLRSVEAQDLSKVYWDGGRRLEVFKQVSLAVKPGEEVVILGPSGSGKTTLLNLLSGLDRPDQGRVFIGGLEIGRLSEAQKAEFRRRCIGFVFQFYHLLAEFTALENVLLPALMNGTGDPRKEALARAQALLERVGLGDRLRHFPSELSGGEKQRVAIARALVNDPKVLFCDEPTGNLDVERGLEVARILRDFAAREKKTVLIVTHDERIAKMADRVWDMVEKKWKNM